MRLFRAQKFRIIRPVRCSVNCSKATISSLLKQHGVNVTKAKARAKIDVKMVIAMYAEMQTAADIAKFFGVSAYAIQRCLCENGIKLRSRWDYPQK